jgi:hypothetical protein
MLLPWMLAFVLVEPVPVVSIGRLGHEPIREASGLVQSRQFPGVFWVHNDSGNPPALYAVRRDGSLIREYQVNVPNVDWEDIAVDDMGRLYIAEIGNNEGRLPLRAIYRLDEPDPSAAAQMALGINLATYYRMGRGERFDAEALVIDGSRALIVAKTFDRHPADVYAVPLDPPAPLLRPATPLKITTLEGFEEPVTGADLSPDGRLVVCSLKTVGVYKRTGADRFQRLVIVSFEVDDQIEAVAWDGNDIILAGEARGIYRLAESTWSSRQGVQGPARKP